MDITIYARGVDDISPVNHDSVLVSLEDVDLSQLVTEVSAYELLETIGDEEIEKYLQEKAELEGEDE